QYQITVVIGLALRDTSTSPSGGSYNVALGITGSDVVRYDKHHLIPSIEADFRPGSRLSSVNGYALTVCKDMDFPTLMRDLGGTGLVLAPAWDFGTDGWLHSRMAVLRGVESGFSVARAARNGALTASDPGGQVRADVTGAGIVTAVADLPTTPITTPYERWPDSFAWLCILVLLGGLLLATRLRGHRSSPRPNHASPPSAVAEAW
ncbi:MAG: apolipoprotein N-acyltransferase, partial [Micromonosporaceae bacterium]|nr:apolipoprotein N-acyltransferase [Micromonosporaceae bacterium]